MAKLKRKKGENGKYGFVDKAGNWIIEPKFDGAEYFELGKAPVKDGNRWGIINSDGTWFLEPEFDTIERSNNGDITVYYYDGTAGAVDEKTGEIWWLEGDEDDE